MSIRIQRYGQKLRTRARFFALAIGLLSISPAWGVELSLAMAALKSSGIPGKSKAAIEARIEKDPKAFLALLDKAIDDKRADPMLLFRVDKSQALPKGFAPTDLVSLDGKGLSVNRSGHRLRMAALTALKAMDRAAKADKVTLLASSCYRSYDYQVEVWNRNIASYGEAETEASVASPGHSQHQLGTSLDFGSISDAFSDTKASRWLAAHARDYGFSLSYPKDMMPITGYKWESWHYRYIGKEAAALEERYFGGIQQYLLLFLEGLR